MSRNVSDEIEIDRFVLSTEPGNEEAPPGPKHHQELSASTS